jgi:hypothetical protein
MRQRLAKHWQIFSATFGQRWLKWVFGGCSLLGIYDLLLSQFFPKEWAEKSPRFYEVVSMTYGWLPWWAWGWIGTAIIAVAAFEYAVRLHSRIAEGWESQDKSTKLSGCLGTTSNRDIAFQDAVFFVAFGYWPDADRPIFDGNIQVPEGEDFRLVDALRELRQAAYDGRLQVWGKAWTSASARDAIFQKIPRQHWEDHSVQYMDMIGTRETVCTSKGSLGGPGCWLSLMVSSNEVKTIWPSKRLDPLKILVCSGEPYDEYVVNEFGRHHFLRAVLVNRGEKRIDGVTLQRIFVTDESILNSNVRLLEPISLAPGQRHLVDIASYNEKMNTPEGKAQIVLTAPSAFFNTSILLPAGDYSISLEAHSIDGPSCKILCRLWVNSENILRIEDLESAERMSSALA